MRALLRALPEVAELLPLNEVLVFRFRPEHAVPDDGGVDDDDDEPITTDDAADDSDFFADESDRPLTAVPVPDLSFDFLPVAVVVAELEPDVTAAADDDVFFPLADAPLLP